MTKHPEYEEFGFEWVDEMYPEDNSECAKTNCGYYYKDENESHPTCHWYAACPGDMAPCEYPDDDEPEWIDDDNGYDPYEGCFTWDC